MQFLQYDEHEHTVQSSKDASKSSELIQDIIDVVVFGIGLFLLCPWIFGYHCGPVPADAIQTGFISLFMYFVVMIVALTIQIPEEFEVENNVGQYPEIIDKYE